METELKGVVIKVTPGEENRVIFRFTATLSEATRQAVVAGRTCGCHIGTTNKYAAIGHEMATIISSFSVWLLWVMVFTNRAIAIATILVTGIGALIAINIDTFNKRSVDKVKCNMMNKVCGMWLIHVSRYSISKTKDHHQITAHSRGCLCDYSDGSRWSQVGHGIQVST